MAGGGSGSRELDKTPTWAVSLVCAIIILISIILEKTLHKVGETFHKRKKISLVEALEKIKAELMILGFISLLLTFGQNYIAKICIPVSFSNTMLPCDFKDHEIQDHHGGDHHGGDHHGADPHGGDHHGGDHHRRLLWYDHRILMDEPPGGCSPGKVPLVSLHGLHQLHIFIFFLAVFHVFYGAVTMMLGRLKIRGWKDWEKQIAEETAASNGVLYATPVVHLSSGTKFDFQKYIKRSLEDDFKVVVGIPPYLWFVAVVYLLLNLKGGLFMFYLSIMPLVVILAVGTKLQSIIAQMAIEIQEKHAVVQGIPLVQVSDRHFWFGKPTLVLYIIHLTLFQNAFEITYFIWIWYEFGLHSCFHSYFSLAIVRVVIGVIVQILCSYITLPLYALVTQMGSHMKKSIFDEQTSKALMNWHNKIKKKTVPMGGVAVGGVVAPRVKKLGGDDSEGGSPDFSPPAQQVGQASIQMIDSNTETANITAQVDIPPEEGHMTKDLLTVGISPTAMASLRPIEKCTPKIPQSCSKPTAHTKQELAFPPLSISRRSAILISVLPLTLTALPQTLLARERRNRKTIPLEDYLTSPDGLKYYDLVEGKGPVAEKGSTVQVHFDCIYRGITAVSSRESKLLAGNRIIAQPYEFQVGAIPGKERKREFVDNPNGLFSAQAAPKPPKAMYTLTEGMRVGGKRTVIIPPEAGYGAKGMNEIPPGAEFELNIELLQVIPPEGK
ncbi:MLO-like protein 5 [Sesamum alatum]|uniref:peptidylprolyl isomerase n=1 Tax=Sesamum alatum TaxID=300844 RepID=A0AAE1YE03_9LAMI|nr:MLO-like protein 5 [Sesamum alatum]